MRPLFDSESERRGARARLRELIREQSLSFGSFKLASGAMSHFYLDLRLTTTHPEGAHLVALLLLDHLQQDWPDAVGGPTLGADPMAGALAALSHVHGCPMSTFVVRSAVKDHGLQRPIEGHLTAGQRVVLIDDVITRGGSMLRAAEAVRAQGAQADRVLTILDRQAGAAESLARAGLSLESLFVIGDLMTPQEQEAAPGPAGGTAR